MVTRGIFGYFSEILNAEFPMARTVKNAKIDSRSSRSKLPARKNPYWVAISPGSALGYYKGAKGGRWGARIFDEAGRKHFSVIGAADDTLDPDGVTVFSFPQAQEKAREFFKAKSREFACGFVSEVGPYTVAQALEDYFQHRERRGAKQVPKDRSVAKVRIVPELGEIDVARLSTRRIRDWHTNLADASKHRRKDKVDAGGKPIVAANDEDSVRSRRATANRTLTVLKAALNHAYHEGKVVTDDEWRKVKPFREVDVAVVRFLNPDEITRLTNACIGQFRDLVKAALLTGCRYGELIKLRTNEFNPDVGTITIRASKAGKPRHVALNEEGVSLFSDLTSWKVGKDLVFIRDDGNAWGQSHQQRPLEAASERAKIEPAVNFHILRHTYASSLAMNGVPMGVIAAQLGHSDTRMTEKHYAHLAPNYIADTVRAALPNFGIVEKSKVSSLKISKKSK